MDAVRVGGLTGIMLGFESEGGVMTGVDGGAAVQVMMLVLCSVAVRKGVLVKTRSAEEGFEPQPEHVEAT